MQNDLISRSRLHKALQREESIIVKGLPYVRTDAVLAKISMAPSVDAVEVVRCENCNASEPCRRAVEGFLHCNVWDTVVRDSGYCYYGGKKERGM